MTRSKNTQHEEPTQSALLQAGGRKHLTDDERTRFLRAAAHHSRVVRTLCGMLAYSGCWLSEALALTVNRVNLNDGTVVFESLKKRRRGVFRSVPLPRAFLDSLNMVHNIDALQKRSDRGAGVRLWPWSRTTTWRHVRDVMDDAGLAGPHAMPKGLRHGVGIAAVRSGIPLNLVQRWLGHAQISTTAAIYADAVDSSEEHAFAARIWE
jgi:integrase/recombinase XerD